MIIHIYAMKYLQWAIICCLLQSTLQARKPADFLKSYIVGGQQAIPHSKPYMAYLTVKTERETFHCGGFLVEPDWVMSAGHCWEPNSKITVLLGAHNVTKGEASHQTFGVLKAHVHPLYCALPGCVYNDIMLLKLDKKARLNHYVQIIKLPSSSSEVEPGEECNIAGWGYTDANSSSSTKVLFEANVDIMSNDYCKKYFYENSIIGSMICAGTREEKKSSTQGDSGGPLVCCGIAEGIVSFGHIYPTVPPAVYTRISSFYSWYSSVMGGTSE